MHELGITRNIVDIVGEHAGSARVKRVSLEIGQLSAVVPEAIRFCFDVCTRDTLLEGAELEIIEIPGRGRCRECEAEMLLDQLFAECACGSFRIECVAGEELRIKEMEIV